MTPTIEKIYGGLRSKYQSVMMNVLFHSLLRERTPMLASILSRALNDRLQRPGWNGYGNLTVEKIRGSSSFVQLGGATDLDLPPKAAAVWLALKAQCQPMLAGATRPGH
jgi:hypothetical protein